MSHKMLRPFIVKVSVLGYFPLPVYMYIFPTISHYDSYLIASNCCYYIAMHLHSVYICIYRHSRCTGTIPHSRWC